MKMVAHIAPTFETDAAVWDTLSAVAALGTQVGSSYEGAAY